MDKGVILSHKNTKHEFFISPAAKPHIINVLIRRAFHLNSDVKSFRHPRGYTVSINEIFQLQHGRNFQIITEQDPEISRQRSENYSQKNLAKSSGRKYPPSQKQLLDSKFFIDDFQLFMSEASGKKDKYFGIVFFSNKKKAQFLGKKILRQLVFEFDHIEFFYALHPIKTHSSPTILGDMLLFTIFKGSKMMKERQFPQNLSAIEEIAGYLKLLLKNGELKLNQKKPQQKQKPKNLIEVQQQRSFDQKIQSPRQNDQQSDSFHKLDLFRMKSMTPTVDKKTAQLLKKQVEAPAKLQSPMKSQLTHQISFQNQFYQPAWFFSGNTLNRIQKCFISALIKNNDQNFIAFCQGLDLKNQQKQGLNMKLMKVFLNELIQEKLSKLSPEIIKTIDQNQENRQSPVFSLLLKLNKFGNIQDFLDSITKQFENYREEKVSYIEIARELEKKKKNFGIVLFEGDDQPVQKNQLLSPKLIGKHEHLFDKNCKIAEKFHKQPVEKMTISEKQIKLPAQFSQAEKAMITDRMLKHDPFLLQNYTIRKPNKKKFYTVFSPQIVRKYLQSTETRYKILQDIFMDLDSKMKLRKLSRFIGLLYFLYKQRIINKKQQKIFFYLYVWSDLNLLGAFQLYLHDMNLQQFSDSLYIIDYQYYLQQKYGIQMTEVQNFTVEMQIQLIYLMVFGQFINLTDKVSIQKFIRAGDCTVLKIVKQNRESKETIIEKLKQFGGKKTQELKEHAEKQNDDEAKLTRLKKQRKDFIEQIRPVHFKNLKNIDLIFQCIDLQEPILSSIFQVYQQSNQLVEWIESFTMYIEKKFQSAHKQILLSKIATEENIDFNKVLECPADIIEAIYEMYVLYRDKQDTADSLKRAAGKMCSAPKQTDNRIVMKF